MVTEYDADAVTASNWLLLHLKKNFLLDLESLAVRNKIIYTGLPNVQTFDQIIH